MTPECRWMGPEDGMEVAREEFEYIRRHIKNGGRVIVGTEVAMLAGQPLIDVEAGQVIVKRRATREEFVQHAPVAELAHGRAPFYYELEVKAS